MTDFELHNLCCKSPPLHPHKLEEERIMESGKFAVLQGLLPKLQEKVGDSQTDRRLYPGGYGH